MTYRSNIFSKFILVGSLLIAATLAHAQAAGQVTKIRFGNSAGIAFPTLIIAAQKGFFEKENLEVEVVNVPGSGAVAEGLASNNLELGNVAPSTAVLAIAKGARITTLSGFEYTFTDKSGKPWEATYVAVRQGEGIRTLQDMRGKKIAVNGLGSAYNYMLMDQFKRLGMDPRKDVTIIPIPFSQMAGALIQKQVDVMVAVSDGVFQARQRIPVDVIGSHTSLERLDISLTSTVTASNEFLKRDADAAVRFLRALMQARDWMNKAVANKDPELLETVARVMRYSPERAKAFWEVRGGYYGQDLAFVNMLDIPPRIINRQLEILESAELLPASKQYSYADFVNISYLRKAYDSLGMKWDPAKH